MRTHHQVDCPHCGMRSNIDMEEAGRALEELEKAWDNLLDRLRRGERREIAP